MDQLTEGSSILTYYQAGVRFSSWSRNCEDSKETGTSPSGPPIINWTPQLSPGFSIQ